MAEVAGLGWAGGDDEAHPKGGEKDADEAGDAGVEDGAGDVAFGDGGHDYGGGNCGGQGGEEEGAEPEEVVTAVFKGVVEGEYEEGEEEEGGCLYQEVEFPVAEVLPQFFGVEFESVKEEDEGDADVAYGMQVDGAFTDCWLGKDLCYEDHEEECGDELVDGEFHGVVSGPRTEVLGYYWGKFCKALCALCL